MEAYKIVFDEQGQAFKKIHSSPNTQQSAEFSEIRARLVHAKGRDATLKVVKQTKKRLFKTTILLLKILKRDFLESAVSK